MVPPAKRCYILQGFYSASLLGTALCPRPQAVGDRGSEWRSLFSALALDDLLVGRAGGAGGSQRSDPVWGAASSNRCGGAAAKRVTGRSGRGGRRVRAEVLGHWGGGDAASNSSEAWTGVARPQGVQG